jgi:predicted MFS family arabinose efflux permease
MFCTGCCFGFAVSPSQAANMATVSAAQTGHGSTLLNTLRQAGSAAGVALLGAVLTTSHASRGDLAGFRVAFASAAILMLLALVLSFFVRDGDAAASMGNAGPGDPATAPWPEAA